jgi:glutamate---cysteine ligase / carboxylate-amine ligase
VIERLFRERTLVARANAIDTAALRTVLDRCIIDGERAEIRERDYLALFGVSEKSIAAGVLWRGLADAASIDAHRAALQVIFEEGTLATRLRKSVGPVEHARLERVYRNLCACLAEDRAFRV